MKNILHLSLIFILIPFFLFSCKSEEETNKKGGSIEEQTGSYEEMFKSNTVLIETEFGNMKIRLYDKTPKHKENFIKLAADSFYNGLLFHRVINTFMIQGGDPDSKNATQGIMLGNGGPGYQIPAEFNDSLFHKKGVIAAAREGDQVNPEKMSSGSQFYIVQGKVFTDEELDKIEIQQSIEPYISAHTELQDIITQLQMQNDQAGMDQLVEDIQKKKDFKIIKIPEFKRKIYKETGGTPHLDNNYTVFGEVIEGLELIDKIAISNTDQNDRPLKDIKMKISVIDE